jgi:hypothetical protein
MAFNPELVESTLFSLLKSAITTAVPGQFKLFSRHARIWANITPAEQPAFFLLPFGGRVEQNQAWGAPRYTLRLLALVYTRADANVSPTNPTAPQTLLNQCWQAIQAALLGTPPGQPQTLGVAGVVNAWIDGEVNMQPGVLDQQCALEAEVHVMCAI